MSFFCEDKLYYIQIFCSYFKLVVCFFLSICGSCLKVGFVGLKKKGVGLKLSIQKTKIIASGPITSWQIDGETMETVTDFIFWGSKITADGDCNHEIKRHLLLGIKAMTNLDNIKKQKHQFVDKDPSSLSYGFSSSRVWMWELVYKESWGPKNWCFWTVVLEKTLESPLDCKEIQPVHPKGIQSWIFIGRTAAEAEVPVLWPPDVKNWLIGKKTWCWERLKAGGKGDDRGWDGWMASPTRWTWVWASSRSWWWTGKPGKLQSMGSQRVRHDLVTELNCRSSLYILNTNTYQLYVL